jgi:hypothetical protein
MNLKSFDMSITFDERLMNTWLYDDEIRGRVFPRILNGIKKVPGVINTAQAPRPR